MKRIAILGSTGSIGTSALKIVKHLPDQLKVVALAGHSNTKKLLEQIHDYNPEIVAVYDKDQAAEVKKYAPAAVRIVSGMEGLIEAATYDSADLVLVAIVGMIALKPCLSAIEAEKTIAIATKEILVSAGEFIMQRAREKRVTVLPVDSEHSAIFQCLQGEEKKSIKNLILTASGGPFYRSSLADLQNVTIQQALNHPRWRMGPKVTIDCSTLMNKGLEMIEAKWLFDIPSDQIKVVIHPQSIIHSMVELIDGSILAQMSEPDMVYPIQYALTYPSRAKGMKPSFDFCQSHSLEFHPPDNKKFPALSLAFQAIQVGGSLPAYLNAANEMLVTRFLKKEITWIDIIQKLEALMARHHAAVVETVETIFSVDMQARHEAQGI